jgi:hypothetical protein
MERLTRGLVATAVLLLGVPSAVLLAYDHHWVRPQLDAVHTLIAAAAPEDRAPPAQVRALIDASHTSPRAARGRAAALVVRRLGLAEESSALGRHTHELLWAVLLPYHLESSDLYGLYASLSPVGTGHGLNQLAVQQFGLSLSQLTPEQAASVVASTFAPGYLARHPEKLAARRDMLLERTGHEP